MNTALARAEAPVRSAARPVDRTESATASGDAWPFNLKLLLGVLLVFAINIAAVLYLAAQMPT